MFSREGWIRKEQSRDSVSPNYAALELKTEPTPANVTGNEEGKDCEEEEESRERMRKTTRALAVLLAAVNQPICTVAIRAGVLQASGFSSPQLALISPGISPSPKLLPLRSRFSCPLHRLLIRGCQALKPQLGSCSLGLPGKASKGWKAICSLCVQGQGN